ncbi:penicillin-binding protein 2 [Flavobacteriaceae bacterium Ap0902]|nr:penicillin-binding protein 2 [Flavobacteriaceae bacterium Ap0902]
MKRSTLFFGLLIIISIVFIARLAYLQLVTDKYILNAFNTSIKREVIYPKRGDILDRDGELLVTNSFDYEIQITPALLEKGFDTIRFAQLLGITVEDFNTRMDEIKHIKGYSKVGTFPLIQNINRDEFTRFQEQMYKFPAVDIVKRPKREYRVNSAGNVLGYIQEVNNSYIARDSGYYMPGDLAGQAGVEKSYENDLRGEKGFRYIKKDIRLRNIGPYKNGENDIPVINGKTIKLSLDYTIQKLAEDLLVNKRGGVVAIEPSTGEILALASSPVIDPNRFNIPGEIYRMTNDSVNKIMYDRALQAQYPPGSPFKVLTGLASFEMGVVNKQTTFSCHHGFRYGRAFMSCHCGRSSNEIEMAIAKSCNSYFSKAWLSILKKDSLSIEKSINQWSDIMKSFGLGKYMGTDLPVGSKGNIPNAAYYDYFLGEGKWNSFSIVSNGIGQGEILTTPIQMANYTAAIANKGWFYTPHIVKEIDGKPLKDSAYTTKNKVLVDPKHFEPMIKGMEMVFTNGTGRRYLTEDFTQAGKTGTAENPHGQDHSIFVLFAPVENPKIAIAVTIENGYWGSRWAAPIASLVAEQYLTDTIKRKYLYDRMVQGDLRNEYRKQEIERLKAKGWYKKPENYSIDSITKDTIYNHGFKI